MRSAVTPERRDAVGPTWVSEQRHPRSRPPCSRRLLGTLLPAGSSVPLLPLRECGLRLLPAGARPRWINQLHPQEQLALPSGLAEHLLGSLHKACVVGQGDFGHGGWRSCAWGRPIAMLPQQPTGLVFVLLGDDLPPLISQQRHKEPTRRLPNPSRMHRGSHRVQLGRLAAFEPATSDGVLVQGKQTGHIAQVSEDHIA